MLVPVALDGLRIDFGTCRSCVNGIAMLRLAGEQANRAGSPRASSNTMKLVR